MINITFTWILKYWALSDLNSLKAEILTELVILITITFLKSIFILNHVYMMIVVNYMSLDDFVIATLKKWLKKSFPGINEDKAQSKIKIINLNDKSGQWGYFYLVTMMNNAPEIQSRQKSILTKSKAGRQLLSS